MLKKLKKTFSSLSCVFVFKTNLKNERLLLHDTYKTFTLRYFNGYIFRFKLYERHHKKNNNWRQTSSKIANIKTNVQKANNVEI